MLSCSWETAQYLFFSSNVPSLFYYSHGISIAFALFFGLFIFTKTKNILSARVLFIMTLLFTIWAALDLHLWATNSPSDVMLFWSITILVETLLYLCSVYFIQTFNEKKDISFRKKIIMFCLLLPIIIALPTSLNLTGVDVYTCVALEGLITKYYTYALELFSVLWITIYAFRIFREATDAAIKKQIVFSTTGVIFFLMALSSGNLIGSLTDQWQYSQFGLFSMPVFIGILGYLVVRYNSFNTKTIATQALVLGLAIVVGSQLFYPTSFADLVITAITFILFIIFGHILVKSVIQEVEQRKKIEQLAGARENFIHFLSHEVKGILGKNINMFDLMLQKDSGVTPDQITHFMERSLSDTRGAVDMVENILHSNDTKDGKIQMNMQPFDLKASVLETVDGLKSDAATKGLTLETKIGEGSFIVNGDKENIGKHVLRNLIDNSIRYTPTGGLTVSLTDMGKVVRFVVKDTGVGITKEDMSKLFTEGGHGKDSIKVNVHSTGYGLYFAKGIIDAHKGKIWAESEGAGKGTSFILELNK
jgi:signal transduction histidine kinase